MVHGSRECLGDRGAAVAGGILHVENAPANCGLNRGALRHDGSQEQLATSRGPRQSQSLQLPAPVDGTAWSPDVARDALRAYVIDHLGASQGLLIVDETGSLKKGMHSAGIGRPYSEAVGCIGYCTVGIFVA
ncbi:MAG: transposase [Caldilineaceae bacterium SB0662_bin_9]|uniref:Transposase n=1 Tax=Caldilineaceae bacterium SB0662_bin_9 TaxID=2605258 RepID=A0A6B1DNJ0_9CHLR|nr:transposase [Caldilineaceae bacterium SB0662_bin_9]